MSVCYQLREIRNNLFLLEIGHLNCPPFFLRGRSPGKLPNRVECHAACECVFFADMTSMTIKCRKCRNLLLVYPEVDVLTAHGESYGNVGVEYVNCETIQEDSVWFLGETGIPEWISNYVSEANWTKGKVNCPQCNSRLGSFDFISGTQCQCGLHTLPPIHIVKCKVDSRFQTKVS